MYTCLMLVVCDNNVLIGCRWSHRPIKLLKLTNPNAVNIRIGTDQDGTKKNLLTHKKTFCLRAHRIERADHTCDAK